jgi:hypothetical protein
MPELSHIDPCRCTLQRVRDSQQRGFAERLSCNLDGKGQALSPKPVQTIIAGPEEPLAPSAGAKSRWSGGPLRSRYAGNWLPNIGNPLTESA